MRTRKNWIAILALMPMVMGLTACDPANFRILIPDYDDSQVMGVKIWYEEDGSLTEHIALTFGETVEANVGEVVMYEFTVDGQQLGVTMPAVVERDATDPDRVTLNLNLLNFAGRGSYRVTTFNEFGDSPFAEGSFTL